MCEAVGLPEASEERTLSVVAGEQRETVPLKAKRRSYAWNHVFRFTDAKTDVVFELESTTRDAPHMPLGIGVLLLDPMRAELRVPAHPLAWWCGGGQGRERWGGGKDPYTVHPS